VTFIRGLDVSQYNTVTDWHAALSAAHSRVYVRMGGAAMWPDTKGVEHYVGAASAGFDVGCYYVVSPSVSVRDQSVHLRKLTQGLYPSLAYAIDLETPAPGSRSWRDALPRIFGSCVDLCDSVAQWSGRAPIIYTGKWFVDAAAASPRRAELARYPLWLSAYVDELHEPSEDTEGPIVPAPWSDWAGWQWSADHGVLVPGIAGHVDSSVWRA